MPTLTVETLWQALDQVQDPEIPVVSLVEMGIIRAVELAGDRAIVKMTPTFSGCPALEQMKIDIKQKLAGLGLASVEVQQVLDPPWTTDWISDSARRKLKSFGLAPPSRHGGNFEITLFDPVACPYCDSTATSLKNSFGPTLCRAIYYCNNCQQPFEQFKPL